MTTEENKRVFRQMYSGAAKKGAVAAALLGAATVFALGRRRARG